MIARHCPLQATSFLLSLTALVSAGKVTNPNNVPKNAILLSSVETLTLRDGRMTSHRRVSAVPQLTCVGSSEVCRLYQIEVMQCKNQGADYDAENIQWACSASLPEEFKLSGTEVMCEGYASSDDPYVLKGSCGVEYRLLLTDLGEKKFGRHRRPSGPSNPAESSTTFATVVFFMIFAAVLFIIIAGLVNQCRQNPHRLGTNDGRPPWFGGGGDNEGGDDPPPYDDHNFSGSRKYKTASGSRNYGTAGSSRTGGRQQQGWRPGPWTAGMAGAGLGYALGRNQNRTRPPPSTPSSSSSPSSRGWFSNDDDAGPSNSRPSSSPSFSSSRYESTGFGGTSRR